MGSKTKKIQAFGKFGAGYGTRVRNKYNQIESVQRQRQICPHCSKAGTKRVAAGIWHCPRCKKTFASHAYILNAS